MTSEMEMVEPMGMVGATAPATPTEMGGSEPDTVEPHVFPNSGGVTAAEDRPMPDVQPMDSVSENLGGYQLGVVLNRPVE